MSPAGRARQRHSAGNYTEPSTSAPDTGLSPDHPPRQTHGNHSPTQGTRRHQPAPGHLAPANGRHTPPPIPGAARAPNRHPARLRLGTHRGIAPADPGAACYEQPRRLGTAEVRRPYAHAESERAATPDTCAAWRGSVRAWSCCLLMTRQPPDGCSRPDGAGDRNRSVGPTEYGPPQHVDRAVVTGVAGWLTC